jgi:phosphohistidine phosphatase SixA
MELLLLRHGAAEFGLPDSARKLSLSGQNQVITMAKTYGHTLNGTEWVLTSPLQRAIETTKLIMANASLNCPYQVVDFLLPESNIASVEQHIQTLEYKKILMVGHLPLLDNWIAYLTGKYCATMATASLASLSMDYAYKGLASLNWIHHAD